MNNRRRDSFWWYWVLTGIALGAGLAGSSAGVPMAMVLTAVHLGKRALHARSPSDFGVQVRVAYLALLVVGSLPFLAVVHFAQLIGTVALVAFDYCPLARILSLMPWNRRGPLTLARLRATFLSPPVAGSILTVLDTS